MDGGKDEQIYTQRDQTEERDNIDCETENSRKIDRWRDKQTDEQIRRGGAKCTTMVPAQSKTTTLLE